MPGKQPTLPKKPAGVKAGSKAEALPQFLTLEDGCAGPRTGDCLG